MGRTLSDLTYVAQRLGHAFPVLCPARVVLMVAVGTSRLSCGKAVKREYSRQFGSHPGNPG
jgi:hypothetical protein